MDELINNCYKHWINIVKANSDATNDDEWIHYLKITDKPWSKQLIDESEANYINSDGQSASYPENRNYLMVQFIPEENNKFSVVLDDGRNLDDVELEDTESNFKMALTDVLTNNGTGIGLRGMFGSLSAIVEIGVVIDSNTITTFNL